MIATDFTNEVHLRVGTDLMWAADIGQSINRFGDRYLTRIYTPAELEYASPGTSPSRGCDLDRLAARFAAKEAVVKALRPTEGLKFTDIEVQTDPDGAPAVALRGSIERHAQAIGLVESSLSLSHEGGLASAFFVALLAS